MKLTLKYPISIHIKILFVGSTDHPHSLPLPPYLPPPLLSHSSDLDVSVKNVPLVEVGKACNNLKKSRKLGRGLVVTSQNPLSSRGEGRGGRTSPEYHTLINCNF